MSTASFALATAILVAFSILATPGCATDPATGQQTVDWHKIDVAGDEALNLLDTQIDAWSFNPDVADRLRKVRGVVELLDKGVTAIIDGGGSVSSFNDTLDVASSLVDTWMKEVDPQQGQQLYATLSSVRGALALMKVIAA